MEGLDLTHLFGGAYRGRRVLVTGHTGFKGSWLVLWLDALKADVAGIALDPPTDPSHWDMLKLSTVADHRIDIRDGEGVRDAVSSFAPDIVFHLAAQPLVQYGYSEPVETFEVNVTGLVNVLEAVRTAGSARAVVNATTDKVYETTAKRGPYVETDPLGGHDPYSASKACAELVSASYRSSYDLPLATARAGNVVGGGDWGAHRLVPDFARAVAAGEPLLLRNPEATRPWQHVLEALSGYLRLGHAMLEGRPGDAWNFGPADDATLTVRDVVDMFKEEWCDVSIRRDTQDHPRETAELSLDASKAGRELGWRPVWDARTTVKRTARWYEAFANDDAPISLDDIRSYVEDAAAAGLAWVR